jgi:ribosomal protein S6
MEDPLYTKTTGACGKLAYPIQKKSTGFYHLVEFEGPGLG